jgi:hypothetical protein
MRFASKTFTRRLRLRRSSKSKSRRQRLTRRKQKGGEPYRGIPPGAVVTNPMEWDT